MAGKDSVRLRSRADPANEDEKGESISSEVHSTAVEVHPAETNDVQKDKLVNEEVVETDADLESPEDPELKDIPPQVLRVVSLHDDPTELCLTFRYWILATVFVAPGAFLSQMNSFRTTYAPYSVFFVQIASNYVGIWLAKVLPKRQISIPGTNWKFSMNPGPWTTKEHVLVTITATSGAIGNLGVTPLALAELYYGQRVNAGAALFFMLSIVWTGYSFAAIARQILTRKPIPRHVRHVLMFNPLLLAWIACFGYKQIRTAFSKFRARRNHPGEGINHQYNDRLNILMRSYEEVPLWWYAALFLCSFVSLITILATGNLFIPVWTYFIAVATGALTIIPMGWLFAVSNFQLPIGTFNELLYGTMLQAVSGNRNPAGASVYGSIAGDAWYRAQYMMQDQKIGHYMHIPPRAVFVSQIFGTIIGVPINYGTMRWILTAKRDYLNGTLTDPAHIWTGQTIATSLSTGVQYVLIGPSRLFQERIFKPLPYAFLVGAAVPVILYTLHRLFPRAKFHLWNSTIFFSGASIFYGNISTGYFSRFLGGFVVMFWAYRYRYELWSRYNYILAAAFDAGFNLNMLLIFLCFGAAKVVTMPNWWGNNADSVERCFALPNGGPVESGDS